MFPRRFCKLVSRRLCEPFVVKLFVVHFILQKLVYLKVRIGSYFCLQVGSTVIVIESNVGGGIAADTDIAAPLLRPSPSPSARSPAAANSSSSSRTWPS